MMKIRKTQIFSLVTLLGALFLGWLLIDSVYTTIKEADRIEKEEAQVVEALKKIRDVEEAYLAVYNRYSDKWDSLAYFLDNDTIYNVEKREIIIPAAEIRSVEEMYKGDSIRVEYDTLGSSLAIRELYPSEAYPDFVASAIGDHPLFPDTKFEVFADTLVKSGVVVNVIEVVDPKPTNPRRRENSPNRKRKPLRFGSRTQVTVSGNWED